MRLKFSVMVVNAFTDTHIFVFSGFMSFGNRSQISLEPMCSRVNHDQE